MRRQLARHFFPPRRHRAPFYFCLYVSATLSILSLALEGDLQFAVISLAAVGCVAMCVLYFLNR